MDNATLFYIVGGALAASAVLVSFLGLRVQSFPGRMGPVVVAWFVLLVGGATTLAVLHAQDEEKAKAKESTEESSLLERESDEGAASEAAQKATSTKEEGSKQPPAGGNGAAATKGAGQHGPKAKAKGKPAAEAATTLQLAADPAAIAFDKTSLTAKAGKVTIDFNNPAPLEHDVAIEQGGKQIAVSELVTQGKTSVTADLAPGTYTFLCTVPGHAEAGMQGTLTVK